MFTRNLYKNHVKFSESAFVLPFPGFARRKSIPITVWSYASPAGAQFLFPELIIEPYQKVGFFDTNGSVVGTQDCKTLDIIQKKWFEHLRLESIRIQTQPKYITLYDYMEVGRRYPYLRARIQRYQASIFLARHNLFLAKYDLFFYDK